MSKNLLINCVVFCKNDKVFLNYLHVICQLYLIKNKEFPVNDQINLPINCS